MVLLNNEKPTLVYPNPLIDEVTVEFLEGRTKTISVMVFNNFGEEVFRQIVEPNKNQILINLSELPAATYHIWMDEDGKKRRIDSVIKIW